MRLQGSKVKRIRPYQRCRISNIRALSFVSTAIPFIVYHDSIMKMNTAYLWLREHQLLQMSCTAEKYILCCQERNSSVVPGAILVVAGKTIQEIII